jgi:hypothetical protein
MNDKEQLDYEVAEMLRLINAGHYGLAAYWPASILRLLNKLIKEKTK